MTGQLELELILWAFSQLEGILGAVGGLLDGVLGLVTGLLGGVL